MHWLKPLDAEAGRVESTEKSLLDIEQATAKTWGGRAAAAYQLAAESSGEERVRWLSDAENYRQESLEHAAMTEDLEFLTAVLADLNEARDAAGAAGRAGSGSSARVRRPGGRPRAG